MSTIIESLQWRYATKKYDATKKVSQEDLNTLMDVLQLTPTSYGLQTLRFLIIENPEVREKLLAKSYGQQQVTDASHLIVLCGQNTVSDADVDEHVRNTAVTRGMDPEQMKPFGDYMKQSISHLSDDVKKTWMSKQAYIALGLLLTACGELKIDATPMEGFQPDGYDEVLGLTAKNLHAAVICPIGYRSEEDHYQALKKVRKSKENLFELI